jgi:signal transduction histidine kinase
MSATTHPSRAPLVDRVPSIAARSLAWVGALAYPFLLALAVINGQRDPAYLKIGVPAALTVLPFALLRRHPVPASLLMLLGWAAVIPLESSIEVGYLQIAVVDLAVGFIAATRRPLLSLIAAALAVLLQIGSATFYTHGSAFVNTSVLIILATITAWMVGNSFRVRQRQAQSVRAQAQTQAITDERLRIARELHDMVAHSIGIIAIQAGVGARVIDTQPDEARNALHTIETTSRETLAGLRRTLGALRRASHEGTPLDPAPGLADLDRLAASTTSAGVQVDLRWQEERRPIPSDIDLAAYRIVQESLTNVVRHAGVDRCRVVVTYAKDDVSVEVTDRGRGGQVTDVGYGLAGMRERVDLLGGDLIVGPRPEGGFRVAARLPLPVERQ